MNEAEIEEAEREWAYKADSEGGVYEAITGYGLKSDTLPNGSYLKDLLALHEDCLLQAKAAERDWAGWRSADCT